MIDMLNLKDKLNIILDHIDDKDDVVFIDFPLHYNVGDLLILKGALSFFEENDIKINNIYSTYNAPIEKLKRKINKKTTIIFHGGGNFGDIYPVHQKIREKYVSEFKDNKIIILPQTAHFDDELELEKSKKLFRMHNNVIMFARDEKTYELFLGFSDKIYLVPDMAHNLYGKMKIFSGEKKERLYFLRKDIEVGVMQKNLIINNEVNDYFDWEDLILKSDKKVLGLINIILKLNDNLNFDFLDRLIFGIWNWKITKLINKFSLFFSSYEIIVTSRLHGHILTCLVDSESKLLDNSYGKNSSYYKIWTSELVNTELLK